MAAARLVLPTDRREPIREHFEAAPGRTVKKAVERVVLAFACCACVACIRNRPPHFAEGESAPSHAGFEVDGAPLCFVGANNYYLSYEPKVMVDDVLESARAMGVKVLRIWAFIDRGSLDGSVPSVDGDGTKRGVYFQAWDPVRRQALYNDGPTGLVRLDYALAKAAELKLKIVLVLTNNWHEFGGMDQYLAWYGLTAHGDFYADHSVKLAYKAWLWHLTSRVNTITQRRYSDDPTIFAWELGNEPRASTGARSSLVTDWANEMSSYLKAIDPQHLVAVGDEGFFETTEASAHWTYRANNGVDHRELTALTHIDYGTFHMYPETWGAGYAWSQRWIDDHLRVARELDKPTVLEEYGLKLARDELGRVTDGLDTRLAGYAAWNERILARGGSAAMFWLLAGRTEGGSRYPDYDQFSVYPRDTTYDLLRNFAHRFASDAPACRDGRGVSTATASPFVRVRKPRPSTFDWLSHTD